MFIPTETGVWVNENFERLARVVQDYDPQFELRWIQPAFRETQEEKLKPYVIWDIITNSPVFFASELDTPEDILTRLFNGDNSKGNVLDRLESRELATKALKMKQELDQSEERQEYSSFLIGTKKNYINLSGGRKVDDQLRPIL
jgi:hypothetical protein